MRNGAGVWVAGLVGRRSERFRRVTLTADDLASLTIADSALSYDGDGRLLRLGLRMRSASPTSSSPGSDSRSHGWTRCRISSYRLVPFGTHLEPHLPFGGAAHFSSDRDCHDS